MTINKNEIRTTAHSTYRCQYHIVFAPKYGRKEMYGNLRKDIGQILRKLCERKRWKSSRQKPAQLIYIL